MKKIYQTPAIKQRMAHSVSMICVSQTLKKGQNYSGGTVLSKDRYLDDEEDFDW